jgi:hypothetical protein
MEDGNEINGRPAFRLADRRGRFGSKLNGGCSMTNVNVSEDDPQRRLDRAEEVRRLAEDLREPETRRMMLSTSEGYDKLAKRAEERARKKPSKQSA